MSTIINATTTNGVVIQPDNSGSLVLQTNSGTTALTVDTSQNTTLAGKLTTASSGIQFSDSSIQTAAASPYVLKNRIINGDMRIDQRNAGASITGNNAVYPVDRYFLGNSQSSKCTTQQNAGSVTPPAGFTNYLGITSSSAYSILSTDYFQFIQKIEGYNISDLAWGTANAKTITFSFWVRSSLTGTFGGSIRNSTDTYGYCFSYTISSANTWEYKTITVTGATSGTWLTNNETGIDLRFSYGMGSSYTGTPNSWGSSGIGYAPTGQVNVLGTNGATWYITGLQFEAGSTATPFERRMYGQELALCQRYYWQQNYTQNVNRFGTGLGTGGSNLDGCIINLPTVMRASPTATMSNIGVWDGTSTYTISSLGANYSTPSVLSCIVAMSGSVTAGKCVQLYAANSSAVLTVTAEV